VHYVSRLLVTGKGTRRTALLIARGRHKELCFTAVVGSRIRHASLSCLKRWDRPPMLVRVAVGGRSRKATDWLTLVGLVRREVTRVDVRSQASTWSRPPLRAWRGFPWKAYALPHETRGRFPSDVRARYGSREVQGLDLGWSYGAACGEQGAPRCTRKRLRVGRWAAVRNPLARGTSRFIRRTGAVEAKRIAFVHPVVRQLVAGQPFSIGKIAEWSKCSGDPIGAILPIRLAEPIDFEGDVPYRQFDAPSRVAYLEGVAHLQAKRAIAFDVDVDLNRKKVAGVGPGVHFMEPGNGVPRQSVDLKVIGELRPAGGPDTGDCGQQGD
jgi:hypothetical protein